MLVLIGIVLLIWNVVVLERFKSPDKNKHTAWCEKRITVWQEIVRVAPLLPEIFTVKEIKRSIETIESWKKSLAREIRIARFIKRISLAVIVVLDLSFISYIILSR